MDSSKGVVYLVGGGPGDPDLITVKGSTLLQLADVVIHDRLIALGLLKLAPPDAIVISVGKAPGGSGPTQAHINRLLVDHALQGRRVVRLKGGDPYLFGRAWEELQACRAAGVRCVVVPGISSALAAPAAANIPVTVRGVARSLAIATAHHCGQSPADGPNLAALQAVDTLVLLMGRANLAELTRQVIAGGRAPETPAACIERATLPGERWVVATLDSLAAAADRAGLRAPVVVVIGAVADYADRSTGTAPLAGRRVLVTRARDSARHLRLALQERGAAVIEAPLIDIRYPADTPELDHAIRHLQRYAYVVFTSVNGVRGFWKRLGALERDARALGSCRVAAIGTATARSLAERGIRVDLLPPDYRATSMAQALKAQVTAPAAVLLPGSRIARPELADGLRGCGVHVDAAVAYDTVGVPPPATALDALRGGVDAILFHSPSAVRQFAALRIPAGAAVIACIGPTTAQAACDAGLPVAVVPERHTDDGLVQALEHHFASEVRS